MGFLINIREFSGAFQLQGTDGASSIYNSGGKLFAEGNISLLFVINGRSHASLATIIPQDTIGLTETGTDYFLESVVGLRSFVFSTMVEISENPLSPVLYISEIALMKSSVLEIFTEKVAISMIGKVAAPDTAGAKLYYNTSYAPLPLTKVASPVSGRLGFYFSVDAVGLLVNMATPATSFPLDHFTTLSLTFAGNTPLAFHLGAQHLLFTASANGTHNLLLANDSDWELDQNTGQGDPLSFLEINSLRCAEGWITSNDFTLPSTSVSKITPDPTVTHTGLRTKIVSDKNAFTLYFPQEIATSATRKKTIKISSKKFLDVPQFTYSAILDDKVGQHYGLRIRGLSSNRGAPVKLDTDLAILRMDSNSSKFYLQAGMPISVCGKSPVNSTVLPKIDFRNGTKRVVKIPCLPAMLVVEGASTGSSVVIDTSNNSLIVNHPKLETEPYSPGNHSGAANNTFDKLNWKLNDPSPALKLILTDDSVKPSIPGWLKAFQIDPVSSHFQLQNTQRADFTYDPPQTTKSGATVTTTVITTEKTDAAEAEKVRYLAYAGILGFTVGMTAGGLICESVNPLEIYTCLQKDGKEAINIKFDTSTEDPAKVKEWLKNDGVNELQIAYYDANDKIGQFIDDNVKLTEPTSQQPTSIAFWSVMSVIGIPLMRKKLGAAATEYCFDILKGNFPTADFISGIGIDQNETSAIDLTNNFGFTPASFDAFVNTGDNKQLFPYYSDVVIGKRSATTNGQSDPTDPKFTGIIFRNMPLMLKVPTDKLPEFFTKLINQINTSLYLEFGWRNDKGFSWVARMPDKIVTPAGIDIVNTALLKFNISNIFSLGKDSRLISFSLDTFIGLFKKTGSPAEDFAVQLAATTSLKFNEAGLVSCVVTPKDPAGTTFDISGIIPGFTNLRIKNFEVNGKQLFADIALFPADQLAESLPIFSEYKKSPTDPPEIHNSVLNTTMAVDLENDTALVSIVMSAKTKLFGKWTMDIKAVSIYISSANGNRVEISGDFNLGLESFVKVGGRVVIRHDAASGWTFDTELDSIGGSIALSDAIKLEGYLSWGSAFPPTTAPVREALKRDELLTKGKSRDFYGVLDLKAPGIFGDNNSVFAKIGSNNVAPGWIVGLSTSTNINLGFGTLQEAELQASYNMDLNNQINTIVSNINGGLQALRKDEATPREQWLEKWQYSNKTGFTIMASGYLVYDLLSGVVTTKPEDKKFTAVLYSSAGIIRIEGWVKMFDGIGDVQILFTIDLRKKRIMVGFQLPVFYFPNKNASSRFEFKPGQILLGTSFGGPFYFLASFGFPPQTGDSFERDWSKANMATYYPPTFPLPNEFGGGFQFEIDTAGGYVLFAVAAKAGWKYELSFGIGKAGLEVTFGGLLVIKYVWSTKSYEMARIVNPFRYRSSSTAFTSSISPSQSIYPNLSQSSFSAFQLIHNELELTDGYLAVLGELFADINGYAEVSVFGVQLAGVYLHAYARLRICGDTQDGITFLGGAFGAEFCVKIGCVTYCKSAEIDIIVISGTCKALAPNYQLLPQLN
jgi:hypothetical protein